MKSQGEEMAFPELPHQCWGFNSYLTPKTLFLNYCGLPGGRVLAGGWNG